MKVHLKHLNKVRRQITSQTLIAVTKNVSLGAIKELITYNHHDLGENRVAHLYDKAIALQEYPLRWHFIGNLQRNKVKLLLTTPQLSSIHSLDSLKILQCVVEKAPLLSRNLDLFLQVNTSGETEKNGFTRLEELREAISFFLQKKPPHLHLKGLMTMATLRTISPEQEARRCFTHLKTLKDTLENEYQTPLKLSMGMSRDYQIALDCGSDILRIGSFLFHHP